MAQQSSIVFLCTGEGEHSPESDLSHLSSSPSWSAVEAAVAELCSLKRLETFFAQVVGEHGHPLSPVASTAINILNADLWRSWGVTPAFALGHSIGEVAAAYVAGVFSLREALQMALRLGNAGSLLSGGMLHTVVPRAHLELRQDAERRGGSREHVLGGSLATANSLVIAAINCEESCGGKERCGGVRCERCGVSVALSGPAPHLDAWLLHDKRARRLRPERPWHHPAYRGTPACAMVSDSGLADSGPACPTGGKGAAEGGCTFVSATTGTDLAGFGPEHWAAWLSTPVQFSEAVRHTARLAQRRGTIAVPGPPSIVTVETGCHPTLSGLAHSILAGGGARVAAQAASMRRGQGAGYIGQERKRLEAVLLRGGTL